MNQQERFWELFWGGPYDPLCWILMVRLAAEADDQGIVQVPEFVVMSRWIGKSEKWLLACIKRLSREGWLEPTDDTHWDISVNLRQGRAQARY